MRAQRSVFYNNVADLVHAVYTTRVRLPPPGGGARPHTHMYITCFLYYPPREPVTTSFCHDHPKTESDIRLRFIFIFFFFPRRILLSYRTTRTRDHLRTYNNTCTRYTWHAYIAVTCKYIILLGFGFKCSFEKCIFNL